MKRITRTIALLCALVLLAALAGCGKDPTPTPNPTPTPEYEMIAVTMPKQQPGEATEKIIKAVNSLSGVWALSEDHNLYRMQLENNEPDMSTMEVAYQHVQDFSLGSFGEYIDILYTTGRLERYWTDHDYGELPEPLEGVAEISGCAALMQDGTVQYYYDGAWHSIEDIKAKKIAEDKGQRLLVLDQNNTLWDYSMEDGSRIETAQKVLDFCYSSANKMYYTSCIWYTTAEKDTLYCHSYEWFDPTTPTDPNIPQPKTEEYHISGVPVYAANGCVLLHQEDGSYLFFAPNYGEKPAVFSLPMKGVYAEAQMWAGYYLIACTDGRLYYHLDESADKRNPYDGAEWVWTLGVQN